MLVKRSGLILTRYVAFAAVAVFYTWLVLICGCGEDFWALNSVSSLKSSSSYIKRKSLPNSLVSGLKLEPPLCLGCLDRGLEGGEHGVCLGEDILIMGLALGHRLQCLLSLDHEVTIAGEAGEQAEQDRLARLLLTFKTPAKILIREKNNCLQQD